jgi:hypothetical protein
LLALASESERAAYERELTTIWQDEFGEQCWDDRLEKILLPRLTEKLGTGQWIASGFGYESGQPTDLDPRLWQRLAINVRRNVAGDSWANASFKSATGSFHSLGFRVASGEKLSGGHSTRARSIAKIAAALEQLDRTLPPSAGKKRFFEEVGRRLNKSVPDAWLKEGWRKAKLQEHRRRPGLKSI